MSNLLSDFLQEAFFSRIPHSEHLAFSRPSKAICWLFNDPPPLSTYLLSLPRVNKLFGVKALAHSRNSGNICGMEWNQVMSNEDHQIGNWAQIHFGCIRVKNSFKPHELFCVWSHSLLLAPETHILSPWGHCRETLTPRGSAGLNIPEWVWR